MVKKDPDAMAKDVKRSMESDGTKLYAGGVDGSYSAFLIFHRNLETSMGDMHPDMAELINIDPDVDSPRLGYSMMLNRYLFKVLWKLTTKSARLILNAHYKTHDGRRALLSLLLRSNPTDILSKKEVHNKIAAIKINGKNDDPMPKMQEIKSLGEQLTQAGSDAYDDDQAIIDILGALGPDYVGFVNSLQTNASKEYTDSFELIEDVCSFYTRNRHTFGIAELHASIAQLEAGSAITGTAAGVHPARSGHPGQGARNNPGGKKPARHNLPFDCRVCSNGSKHFLSECPLVAEIQKQKGITPKPREPRAPIPRPTGQAAGAESADSSSDEEQGMQDFVDETAGVFVATAVVEEKTTEEVTHAYGAANRAHTQDPFQARQIGRKLLGIDYSNDRYDTTEGMASGVQLDDPAWSDDEYDALGCIDCAEVYTVQTFMMNKYLMIMQCVMACATFMYTRPIKVLLYVMFFCGAACALYIGPTAALYQSNVTQYTADYVAAGAMRSNCGPSHIQSAQPGLNVPVAWMPDSGASHHLCNSKSAFVTLDTDAPRKAFKIAGPHPIMTEGVGEVLFPVWDYAQHEMYDLLVKGVYYVPNQPFNLMSVKQMIRRQDFESPDFKRLTWQFTEPSGLHRQFRFEESFSTYIWRPVTGTATAAAANTTRLATQYLSNMTGVRLKSEVMLQYRGLLGNADTGNFDHILDLSNDGKQQATLQGTWNQSHVFGIPAFTNKHLFRVLDKAQTDFTASPSTTGHTFMVPVIENTSWWHYTKYYSVVHTFQPGTKLFVNESGQSLPGAPYAIAVIHRDATTPYAMDDYMKAHLRFGHYSAPYIAKAIDQGVKTGLRLDTRVLRKTSPGPCGCHICTEAKMRRPGPFRPHENTHVDETPFSNMVLDVTGPIEPASPEGYRHVIGFTCRATGYGFVYFMQTRDQAGFYLEQMIADVKTMFKSTVNNVVHTVKSDNAGEFTGAEGHFRQVVTKYGLRQEFSGAYLHEELSLIHISEPTRPY